MDSRHGCPKGFRNGSSGNQFTYSDEPGPSKRRRCREWGITYITRPGEEPAPEIPQPPTA